MIDYTFSYRSHGFEAAMRVTGKAQAEDFQNGGMTHLSALLIRDNHLIHSSRA